MWTKAGAGTGLTLEGWGTVWGAKARASRVLGGGVEWGCVGNSLGHELGRGDLGLTVGLGCGPGEPLIRIVTAELCLEVKPAADQKSQSSLTPQLLSTYHDSFHPRGQQVCHSGPGGSQGHSPSPGSTVYSLESGKDHV